MRLKIDRYGSIRDLEFALTPGITAIVGPNGAGKSTVLDAIMFALYGQDRFGGPADVKLTLWHGDNSAALSTFHRYRKGKNTTLEAWLFFHPEEAITKQRELQAVMKEERWLDADQARITWFGVQGQLGFLGLSPRGRRAVIEELLNLEVWDQALERARRERNAISGQIKRLDGAILEVKQQSARLQSEREALEGRLAEMPEVEAPTGRPPAYSLQEVERAEQELAQLRQELEVLQAEADTLQQERDRLRGAADQNADDLRELAGKIRKIEAQVAEQKRYLKAASIETPCTPDMRQQCAIAIELHADQQAEIIQGTLDGLAEVLKHHKEQEAQVAGRLKEIQDTLKEVEGRLSKIAHQSNNLIGRMKILKEIAATRQDAERWTEDMTARVEAYEQRTRVANDLKRVGEDLDRAAKRLEELDEEWEELAKKEKIWAEAISDLGPRGVRHHLLAEALPSLFARANEVLDTLDAPFQMLFELERELTKGGKGTALEIKLVRGNSTVDADTASGGERVLLDLAFRLALSDAYRSAGWFVPDLLVLDETLAPLDMERRLAVLEGITRLGVEKVILTSHVSEVVDYADDTIEVG